MGRVDIVGWRRGCLMKEKGDAKGSWLLFWGSNFFNFWHVPLCQRRHSRELRNCRTGGNLFASQFEISRFKTEMFKNGLKIGHRKGFEDYVSLTYRLREIRGSNIPRGTTKGPKQDSFSTLPEIIWRTEISLTQSLCRNDIASREYPFFYHRSCCYSTGTILRQLISKLYKKSNRAVRLFQLFHYHLLIHLESS